MRERKQGECRKMNVGIFTRTYETTDLKVTYQKMRAQGICHAQLNLSNAGLPTLPDTVDDKKIEEIGRLTEEYGITLEALSGTFNMADPDEEARRRGCSQFRVQCRVASMLKIPVVSLCTGSRDPENKWRWHEDNSKQSSWDTLMRSTEILLGYAQEYKVILGVEPETANIVNTPQKARKYLDTFASPNLKIIMDGANLFGPGRTGDMKEVLEEAFALLGEDIVLAHAKDFTLEGIAESAGGENDVSARKRGTTFEGASESALALEFAAAGEGLLDYSCYIRLLKQYGYQGSLIMHGLSEAQAPGSLKFLEEMIRHA